MEDRLGTFVLFCRELGGSTGVGLSFWGVGGGMVVGCRVFWERVGNG